MLEQNKEPAVSAHLAEFKSSIPKRFDPPIFIENGVENLTPKEIMFFASQAEIYDERDGRLLVSKLRRAQNSAEVLIVDAVDDEPYISSKITPMLQCTDDLLLGIELCAKVLDITEITIHTYKHMGHVDSPVPKKMLGEYPVERLGGGYPALPSFEQQLRVKGDRPTVTIGVGALIHLARAITRQVPQSTTFITVAGNSVATPMNLEVSLGITLTSVLERCGLKTKPNRVIFGGPMTGVSVIDTDRTIITPTTRAVLAFHGEDYERAYPCIGCGKCELYCPSGLNPTYIHQIIQRKAYSQLSVLDPQYCIMCGTCSYVCPSRLDLIDSMGKAKNYAFEHFIKEEPKKEEEQQTQEENTKEEPTKVKEEAKDKSSDEVTHDVKFSLVKPEPSKENIAEIEENSKEDTNETRAE